VFSTRSVQRGCKEENWSGGGVEYLHRDKCVCTCVLFRTVSEMSYFTVRYTVHRTDEQHAMSSHEMQNALMLTVEFSKIYCTR
jgi:hypothetical protein